MSYVKCVEKKELKASLKLAWRALSALECKELGIQVTTRFTRYLFPRLFEVAEAIEAAASAPLKRKGVSSFMRIDTRASHDS